MSPIRRSKNPVQGVVLWVKRQPLQRKTALGVLAGIVALFFLRFLVRDHDNLFVAAEAIHVAGILVLIYKLTKEKNCAGLSLKTQELTAVFLAVRLWCSFMMEYNTHTILDLATLAVTLWAIFTLRYKLKKEASVSLGEKDNMPIYYVLVPCAVLAVLIHPNMTFHPIVNRILWAFCVYLEAVSVLPQLRVMQNSKLIEPFTAHYVFALGVARFFSCAHWVLQMIDRGSFLLGGFRVRWLVASHGYSVGNCTNTNPGRLLLLLCQECNGGANDNTPTVRGGLAIRLQWLASIKDSFLPDRVPHFLLKESASL